MFVFIFKSSIYFDRKQPMTAGHYIKYKIIKIVISIIFFLQLRNYYWKKKNNEVTLKNILFCIITILILNLNVFISTFISAENCVEP